MYSPKPRKGIRLLANIYRESPIRFACIVLFLFLTMLTAQAPATAVLRIRIINVPSTKGNVRVGLWNRKDGWLDDAKAFRKDIGAISSQRTTAVVLAGLPPAQYAVAAMHDENLNAKLDKNFLGYPKEAVAFSNGATIKLSAPSFESALFGIQPGEQMIELDFQTFKKW